MRRILVLALLALALPAWAEDAPDDSYAMRAECYVEGDRAGIRFRPQDTEGQGAYLMVTDGHVCALYLGGVRAVTMEGARTLRERLAPYAEARRAIAAELDVRLHEDEAYVELCAMHYTGHLSLADGMPLAWESRNPKSSGRARGAVAEPTLTLEAWNELIDEHCRGVDPSELTLNTRNVVAAGPRSFLYAVMKHVPDLAGNAERQTLVAKHLARIELGRLTAEDGQHLQAKASRLVEDLRGIVRNLARELGWPEAGAEGFGEAIAEALRSTEPGARR